MCFNPVSLPRPLDGLTGLTLAQHGIAQWLDGKARGWGSNPVGDHFGCEDLGSKCASVSIFLPFYPSFPHG